MGFWSKLTIVVLIILTALYVKSEFFDGNIPVEKRLTHEEQISEPPAQMIEEPKKEETKPKEKKYATIYYLGTDSSGNNLFKTAKREMPEGSTQLKFALEQLVQGPSQYEKKQGVYSEIPKSTKVLSVVESNKIVINLSSDIVKGGGADSLYSRIKQVIKTALANSPKKPIYLYIDGKQADVIGGEGLMLSQPLNEKSLDE